MKAFVITSVVSAVAGGFARPYVDSAVAAAKAWIVSTITTLFK